MKNAVLGGVFGLLVGLALGYWPMQSRMIAMERHGADLQKQYDMTRQSWQLSLFANRAAMVREEVRRNNFGTARDQASSLFTDLRGYYDELPPGDVQQNVEHALAPRDAVISGLAMADPSVANSIDMVFTNLAEAARQKAPTGDVSELSRDHR